MSMNPEVLRKLLQIFREELAEQLQTITNGLLKLEKGDLSIEESDKVIEIIFRSAHNIKGAARGVGVKNVGDIAHQIETLFSDIQRRKLESSPAIIDLCLEAVDNMRAAMDAFTQNTPLPFDLNDILSRLANGETGETSKTDSRKPEYSKKNTDNNKTSPAILKEYETIRVSIDSLDRITALMEEIQVNKISIEDHYSDIAKLSIKTKQMIHVWKQLGYTINNTENNEPLQKLYHSNTINVCDVTNISQQLQKSMRESINELAILSDALQEELRMLRLMPASALLHTLPRTARDISQELGKRIELSITGDAVKMDKLILEGLQNPLMHLLRNAIDHGIESEDVRRSLGKPVIGKIQIHVQDEGDQILISVSDDGGGIDVKQIAAIAENKNIFNKSTLDKMSPADILELVFRPGFSTKEIITDVSGRGIGLNVVKENIANLKGQVTITSEIGKGTTFHLRVPLTLASERGLLIKCVDELFVIPTSIVERVLLLKASDIIDIEASQAIVLNEHPIPLRSLADVLGFTYHSSKQEQFPIVVLRKEKNAVALLVSEIIGEREIVVKPLQAPLDHILSVAGGTLSGNGQAIIVLNTNDLINTALQLKKAAHIVTQDSTDKTAARIHILVVDDSITTRTMEKNILESRDYQVTVAVNGKEAWDLLQKQKFSILITDINMPVMDGFTLTENVKKHEKLHDLPVIIVTSMDSEEEKKRGIEVGADAYIVKSQFESEALLEIVEQLV